MCVGDRGVRCVGCGCMCVFSIMWGVCGESGGGVVVWGVGVGVLINR